LPAGVFRFAAAYTSPPVQRSAALKLKAELSGHYVQRKEDVTPPADLRQKLTQSYVNCLPAETRRKVAELLAEQRSLEARNQAIEGLCLD
jgi:hypothetical protein